MAELNAQEIINFIANADKKTPVKVYLNAQIADLDIPNEIKVFGGADSAVLFGDWQIVKPFLAKFRCTVIRSKRHQCPDRTWRFDQRPSLDRGQCCHHDGSDHQHWG